MSYMHADEERRLYEKIRRFDPAARDELIEIHYYVIRRVLPRYLNQGVDKEDLFQEGILGLCRAVDDFDPDKARFATLADIRVCEALRMAVFRQGNTIKAPIGVQRNVRRRRRFEREFEERNGRNPTKDEVVEALQISPKAFDKTTDAMAGRSAVSLESQRPDDSRIDPVDPKTTGDPAAYLRSESVRRGLMAMPPKQRRVLARRFGITCDRPQSLAEIGRDLGFDKERTARIYDLAVESFKTAVLAGP